VVVQFARGCPHHCKYCGQRDFWQSWRHRDPVKFAAELARLHRQHCVEAVNFADENPTALRGPWQAFFKALIAQKVPLILVGSTREVISSGMRISCTSTSARDPADHQAELRRFRLVLGIFILALVLSGITAFPLLREFDAYTAARGLEHVAPASASSSFDEWILTVRDGLRVSYARYPWLAYGTDWLAFAHIVIAVFFIGPLLDPVRNVWVLRAGLIACLLVIPLALICGVLRQIPVGWRLIDCSFGVFGSLPLYYCLQCVKRLEAAPE
jgi:hypothetical protein